MRKKNKVGIVCLFLIIFFSICLIGCSIDYDYDNCISEEEMPNDLKDKLKSLCCKSIMKEDNTRKLSKDDIYLKYYIGRYGRNKNAYVLIFSDLEYQYSVLTDSIYYFPRCYDEDGNNHSYTYVCLPERVTVIYKNKIYSISQACENGIISYEEFCDIHNRFITIKEVVDIFTERDKIKFLDSDLG